MPENRNNNCGLSFDGRGTVCIDTYRVLDCCRDRDCFEDTRVYLSSCGEEIVASATNVRTRKAKIIRAFVGLDEVPFNNGFFRITVRYYIHVEIEACIGMGRSQTVHGIAVVEKEVILFGGEGRTVSFSSNPENSFCTTNECNMTTSDPIAVVETVDPIVLGTRIDCCDDPCGCDITEIPEGLRQTPDGDLIVTSNSNGPNLFVSFGIFSVIRIQREAQLLVNATDYSVPDKECTPRGNDDNPCRLFRTIAFPTAQFRGTTVSANENSRQNNGGCGCGRGENR